MRRIRLPLVLIVVLVAQTSLLARLHLFGAVPDAMLLLAICAGIVGGRERGAVVGFLAGITIDLFLETTPEGLSALVFALVAYGVGVVGEGAVRAAWWIPVLTAAVGSIAGVVLFAMTATVVAGADVLAGHVARVAVVVGVTNTVLAPAVLRLSSWAVGREVIAR